MDVQLFIKELGDKLRARGIPVAEDALLDLCDEMFKHIREFQYDNAVVGAIMVAAAAAGEPLLKEQIEKIDPTDNV